MNSRQREQYWRRYSHKQSSYERKYYNRVRAALREQIKPCIEKVQAEGVLNAQLALMSLVPMKPITDVLREMYIGIGVDQARWTWREIYGETGKAFMPSLHIKEFGADPTDADETFFQQYMKTFFDEQGFLDAITITATTRKQISRALQKGIENGWGTEEMVRYLRGTEMARITRIRARLIVRTESVTASNEASLISAQRTGLSLKKGWSAALNERTRPAHRLANGQEVEMDEKFLVGGERMKAPGDSTASAGNRCNCRCAVYFTPKRRSR